MNEEIELMKRGEKAARLGLKSKREIIEKINHDKHFQGKIKDCLVQFGFRYPNKIVASQGKVKADVELAVDDQEIGFRVKSSIESDTTHIDRRQLENWRTLLTMDSNVFEILRNSILRKAINPKSLFILPDEQDLIKPFFESNLDQIVNEIFTKKDYSNEFFVIFNRARLPHRVAILRMNDVIECLIRNARNRIGFTDAGIVAIGHYLTVQRKGGDSSSPKAPTNWTHPGNDVQFKLKLLSFERDISKLELKHYIIELTDS